MAHAVVSDDYGLSDDGEHVYSDTVENGTGDSLKDPTNTGETDDPDATFLDVSLISRRKVHNRVEPARDVDVCTDLSSQDNSLSLEETQPVVPTQDAECAPDYNFSQEETQPVVPTQDAECVPDYSFSQEETQPVIHTQDVQSSPEGFEDASGRIQMHPALDVCDSQESTQLLSPTQDIVSSHGQNEMTAETEKLQTQDSSSSQENTQPITPSQKIECSPEKNDEIEPTQKGSSSQESTQPIIPSQDIESSAEIDVTLETTQSPVILNPSKQKLNHSTELLGKPVHNGKINFLEDGPFPLNPSHSVPSSSSSTSQAISSSSSSSKRPTDSDDTDEFVPGSQDIFATQTSSQTSQTDVVTVSQFLPTLQFSGEIPSSQSYEGFRPNLMNPSSPSASSTSTPLRHVFTSSRHEPTVISLSDEEDVAKLSEKRKLSDSSDEAKHEAKRPKRQQIDTRQSVMILDEVNTSRKPSTSDSEDPSMNSQAIYLHLSQTDPDISESQETDVIGTQKRDVSWKSHSGLTVKVHSQSDQASLSVTKVSDLNNSIVHIEDDIEDEVQCVSVPQPEIVLDVSGPQQLMSKSGDVEVLLPTDRFKMDSNVESKSIHETRADLSPSQKYPDILSPRTRKDSSDCKQQSLNDSAILELDNSKENIQPGKEAVNTQEFEGDFVFTFSCTYKVSCKTVIDVLKKEPVSNIISMFDVLESKTIQRGDSSPSTVEDSGAGSPGSIASGPGPFALQPSHAARFSMMSTTSSSSSGSSASNYRRPGLPLRGRAAVPLWKGTESPVKSSGVTPWKDLLSQCQDVLAESGSKFLEKWSVSNMSNSSSDESKTISEGKGQALDVLLEDDDEEVLGVPLAASKKPILVCAKRTHSSHENETPLKEEVVMKSECETPTSKKKRGRPPKAATPRTPRSSTKKKAPTPRKMKDPETLPTGDQSSLPEDSSLSSGSFYFVPGCQVFAEWEKGWYYPGKIECMAKCNQWNVIFHDGCKETLSKNKIVLINTFEIGDQVSVCVGNVYKAGEITNVTPLEKGNDLFTVKMHESGESVTVPISKLGLERRHVEKYLPERPVSAASTSSSSPTKRASSSKCSGGDRDVLKNLDLDLPGTRTRTPKGSNSKVNSPSKPGPSNTARRLIPDGNGSSTADDEPLATALVLGPNIVVQGVHAEKVGFATADPLARKGKGVKNSLSKKPLQEIEDENVVKQLGPIPPNSSKIFAGFTFILTQTDVVPKHRPDPLTDSEVPTTDVDDQSHSGEISQYPSDSECFKFTFMPMVKDRLAHQIIHGGGKVLKDWTEIMAKDIKNTYVVSNRPCLTPIFLHCLVRGVKGVGHDYIINCCRQGKKFSSELKLNLLPVGYSLMKKDFVLWSEHKSHSCPLKGDQILVVGNNKNFERFWDDLLKLSGVNPSSLKSSRGMSNISVLVAEQPCSELYLKRAAKEGIPVVSPAWITQSLIFNKRLDTTAHPSFKHDYVESD